MGGREVLELIHQQHSAHSAGCGPGGRVGEQHVDGPHNLVVEVDDASLLQRLGVSRSQVREALNVGGVVELHRNRVAQPQPRSAQGLQPCRQRVGHGPAPAAGRPLLYQVAQQVAHFPLVDHLYPAVMCGSDEGASSVAHRQGQAVEGANLQSSEVGGALLHLGAGPHVVGHQAHRGRSHTQVPHEPAGPLGEHPGLAGSGRGHDARAPSEMAHRPPLVGCQVCVGLAVRQDRQIARGETRCRNLCSALQFTVTE